MRTQVHLAPPMHPTLRKKTEPKQCLLGTVLKNGAPFSKKGTRIDALLQKGTKIVPQRAPKGTILVPFIFLSVLYI